MYQVGVCEVNFEGVEVQIGCYLQISVGRDYGCCCREDQVKYDWLIVYDNQ